jgi:hypothetical protein
MWVLMKLQSRTGKRPKRAFGEPTMLTEAGVTLHFNTFFSSSQC